MEDTIETTRLNYVRWCNKEAMRLYPVAPFITRILSQPLDVDGYNLPAGNKDLILYLSNWIDCKSIVSDSSVVFTVYFD